ncbi:D-alanyl-D-alanine carboxypeptidase [Prauserella rugosa]|nr:D-alanyl-D-alanine carboxypeptidase [Prauserella rugosa]
MSAPFEERTARARSGDLVEGYVAQGGTGGEGTDGEGTGGEHAGGEPAWPSADADAGAPDRAPADGAGTSQSPSEQPSSEQSPSDGQPAQQPSSEQTTRPTRLPQPQASGESQPGQRQNPAERTSAASAPHGRTDRFQQGQAGRQSYEAQASRPGPPQQHQPRPQQQQQQQQPQQQQPQRRPQTGPQPGAGVQPRPGSVPPAGMQARPVRIEPQAAGSDASPESDDAGESGETAYLAAPAGAAAPEAAQGPGGPPDGPGNSDAPPQPEPEPEGEAKPRRGRTKALLLGATALVLVVAVGIVLALPAVSNRLGLPWAPNAPLTDPPQPIAVASHLQGVGEHGQAPTAAGVQQALSGPARDGALGTLSGMVVDPLSGETLWSQSADRPVAPASATKILTAAAALLELGPDARLTTKAVEVAPGQVVVEAGGDVTLSSLPEGEESLYRGAARLDDLAAKIDKATGGEVSSIAVDNSLFTGDKTGKGWAGEDAPSTYAAPVEPVMLDGGRSDPLDDGSKRTGTPSADFAKRLAAKFPGASVDAQGGDASGGRVIAEVESAPVERLVEQMLELSDNTLAEAIQHQVAISTGNEATFPGGAKATLEVLSRHGFDVEGVTLNDGSGLSVDNRIPAQLLTEIIAVAAGSDDAGGSPGEQPSSPAESSEPDAGSGASRTETLRPILSGLPVAGGTGTLSARYDDGVPAQGRGWVRAKTGTIPSIGTNALTGYVVTVEGRVLAFSLITSGARNTDAAREALDTMTATLRECGCR